MKTRSSAFRLSEHASVRKNDASASRQDITCLSCLAWLTGLQMTGEVHLHEQEELMTSFAQSDSGV